MTIALDDNTPRKSYTVSQGATQTSFTVDFEFFDNADLNVYVDGTLKTLTSDYTVSGGNGSTGTVSISVTGATGGSTVVITRDIDLKRTTDFPASGAFQVDSLNTELDKLIAIAADLDDKASRALQLTDFDTAVSLVLPDVDTRKGKTLAFNASTGAIVTADSVSFTNATTVVATFTISVDGTYFLRLENNDGIACRSASAILTVSDAPGWTTAAGSLGTIAGNFSGTVATVAASGDTVTFSETTNVLTNASQANCALNSSTGVITTTDFGGSSTTPTLYTFTLRATDAQGQTADRVFTLQSSFGATGGGQFN